MNYRTMPTEELKKKLRNLARLQDWCTKDGAEDTARHYALVITEIEDVLSAREKDAGQVDLFGVPAAAFEESLQKKPMREAPVMSTGQKIRAKRTKKKLTQKQLGMLIAVDENTISSYETGRVSPTVERLKEMAEAMGCDVAEIM